MFRMCFSVCKGSIDTDFFQVWYLTNLYLFLKTLEKVLNMAKTAKEGAIEMANSLYLLKQ